MAKLLQRTKTTSTVDGKEITDEVEEEKSSWVETVSKIANSTTPTPEDLSRFWQLYWGPLAAVEDNRVDSAMVIFGKRLGSTAPASKECLTMISLLLAHCVKQSWSDTWHVQLDRPPELPCTDESFKAVSACK